MARKVRKTYKRGKASGKSVNRKMIYYNPTILMIFNIIGNKYKLNYVLIL